MGINKKVFGSDPERSNFYKLSRQWGSKYRVYPNLPFLTVFNTENLVKPEAFKKSTPFDRKSSAKLHIGDLDYGRLKKTSIDFTLCDESDKPLLCIEFDGMLEGFNVGTEYHHDGPPDVWRDTITTLKLRVAHGSMFPFFVVGSEHFKDLSGSDQLTMVDGIIGEVLANTETSSRAAGGFQPVEVGYSQEDFESLPPRDQQEVVQDWLIGVEVEAELKHNPISLKAIQLQRANRKHLSITWLSFPSADNATTKAERREILDNAILTGCRCTLHDGMRFTSEGVTYMPSKEDPISVTVWLPNFNAPGCLSVLGLVENIAKLVAFNALQKSKES